MASPGPVARGPDGFDVVFENDRPINVTCAEAGACVLHQGRLGLGRLTLACLTTNLKLPIAVQISAIKRK